jgi:shikimate dehydrogenase
LNYCYLAFPVVDLEGAVRGIRALGNFGGLSVTIPHKVTILPLLDEIEETARHIGSVNTVVKQGEKLIGYNTDASGALAALEEAGVALLEQRVLLLGSGGAARAIAFALATSPQKTERITIAGIDTLERATLVKDLTTRTGARVAEGSLDEGWLRENLPHFHLLIHCTPVGMHPKVEASVVPPGLLRKEQSVMDIVYNPLETRLLREAREVGCRTIRGLQMFLHQATAQFQLWTDQPAPLDLMRAVLEDHFQ